MTNKEKTQSARKEILIKIRASIMLAGGCEISNFKLEEMKFDELLSMLYPNGIKLSVKFSTETIKRYEE